MGSLNKTGVNSAHDTAMQIAESTRQVAVAAAGTGPSGQAAVDAAEIIFHRAVIASCKANNSSNGLEASISALKDLGTGGI
jgi:hypothetical protein